MLIEAYIDALLVNEELADLVVNRPGFIGDSIT